MGVGCRPQRPSYFHQMGTVRPLVCLLFAMLLHQGKAAGPFVDRVAVLHAEVPILPNGLPEIIHVNELNATGAVPKENSRTVGGLLAVFLGPFGAHRLYLGTSTRVAIIYGITFGGFGVLPLLDLGHILFTKDLGAYRQNDRVFMWRERAPTPP